MNTTVPLTKFGAERLKEELHQLKTKERRSVIDAIAEARSHGDLSENAEYDAAKERQAFVEGRIAELESGQKVTYQIVGIDEADLKMNKVSVTSPIARALIGKYAGDVVEVQAPSGPREYEIIEVRYV
jgi:transcription elongation factor GreA